MLAFGMIKAENDMADARMSHIMLTAKGRHLVADTRKCIGNLTNEYEALLGAKKYALLIDCMYKILQHHETQKGEQSLGL